jgi:hypothetical protein
MAPTPLLQAARAAPARRLACRSRRCATARAAVAAKPLRAPQHAAVAGVAPAAGPSLGRGAALALRRCVARTRGGFVHATAATRLGAHRLTRWLLCPRGVRATALV